MSITYLKLFFDQIRALEPYSDEEVGRIIRAMARYAEFGEEPAFQGNERFIWSMLKDAIDRASEKYEELCATRKECGSKGGRPKKPKGFSENQMVIEKPKGFSENQKNLREEQEQEQEEEPPPPTPSRGKKPDGFGGGGGEYLSRYIKGINQQEFSAFLHQLPVEVVNHAADEAVAHGFDSWAYVRGILNRYIASGIRTVEQARASDGRTSAPAKPKTKTITENIVVNGEIVPWTHEVPVDDNPWGLSPEALERKRREEARTLARLRGVLPE